MNFSERVKEAGLKKIEDHVEYGRKNFPRLNPGAFRNDGIKIATGFAAGAYFGRQETIAEVLELLRAIEEIRPTLRAGDWADLLEREIKKENKKCLSLKNSV